jgi:hypothetical protein
MMVVCRKCGRRFRVRSTGTDEWHECPECRSCANEGCNEWVFRPGSLCRACEDERKSALSQPIPELPKGKRLCMKCRANVLSAYNRGKYCHSCWSAMNFNQRVAAKERFVD